VDDTFWIIPAEADPIELVNFLNLCHPNIKFTIEHEQSNTLPFIGLSIVRNQSADNVYSYATSIFHKPTTTPLTMKFNSFSPMSHRLTVIMSGVSRILKLCSSWSIIHTEIQKFRALLLRNSFPCWLVDSLIKKCINNFVNPIVKMGPQKERIFLGIPFIGQHAEETRRKILHICKKFIPHKDFYIYFKPSNRVGNFFKTKDSTPLSLRSYVIYEYKCAICQAGYVGQTTRHLRHRIAEHQGVSHVTLKDVKNKVHSNIRDHMNNCANSSISLNNFRVLATGSSELDLLIKERLLISQCKPNLNGNIGSFELILN